MHSYTILYYVGRIQSKQQGGFLAQAQMKRLYPSQSWEKT